MPFAELADVLRLARQLSPLEKMRLIEQMAPDVEAALIAASPPRRRGLRGLLRDSDISAEEFDAARRDHWQRFSRGDV